MKTVEEEVDEIINTPGFTMEHCGMVYKLGTHGFVYRWSETSNCWLKSIVDVATLRHPIASRINRERANETTD